MESRESGNKFHPGDSPWQPCDNRVLQYWLICHPMVEAEADYKPLYFDILSCLIQLYRGVGWHVTMLCTCLKLIPWRVNTWPGLSLAQEHGGPWPQSCWQWPFQVWHSFQVFIHTIISMVFSKSFMALCFTISWAFQFTDPRISATNSSTSKSSILHQPQKLEHWQKPDFFLFSKFIFCFAWQYLSIQMH